MEEHPQARLAREHLATVAQLCVYDFARLFKASVGLSLHHCVITRCVERAKELLRGDLSLAEVAARVGFSPLTQISSRFQGRIGVTPGQFRTLAGTAERSQGPPRDRRATPLHFPNEQNLKGVVRGFERGWGVPM
jgi:AraC-like DNA-binding protein